MHFEACQDEGSGISKEPAVVGGSTQAVQRRVGQRGSICCALLCRGGKHDRDYRDDEYYDDEAGAAKGAEGGTKRRRRASPSPSKSR